MLKNDHKSDDFDLLVGKIKSRNYTGFGVIALAIFIAIAFAAWAFWASNSIGVAKWAGSPVPSVVSSNSVDPVLASAGAWGDSFGGFNALFGALGFTAVSSTLYLQYKSLEQQRIDLHIQRFEATFFELLRLIRQLRSELQFQQSSEMQKLKSKIMTRKRAQEGFDAIKFSFFEIVYIIRKNSTKGKDIPASVMVSAYMDCVHGRFESRFSPYFRIIYTILYKIKNDNIISEDQKFYYANIIRSQLTSHEICLLAINALCPVSKDLNDYIIHFRMLKYAPEWGRKILSLAFPDEAFAPRD